MARPIRRTPVCDPTPTPCRRIREHAQTKDGDKRLQDESGDSQDRKANAVASTVAGALAGAVSRFATGPLDVLKIRFQVQLEPVSKAAAHGSQRLVASKYTSIRQAIVTIFREEGIQARGWPPFLLWGVWGGWSEQGELWVSAEQGEALRRRHRPDAPRAPGAPDASGHRSRAHNATQGLWRGTVPGQLLSVPYTAAQFLALHQARAVAARHGWDAHPATAFVTGALAGMAGTVASYPFDFMRTTLAAQGVPRVYGGMLDVARGVVAQHGVQGLYRGLGITILEILPYSALQFGLYDHFNRQWTAHRVRGEGGGVGPIRRAGWPGACPGKPAHRDTGGPGKSTAARGPSCS